jgi:CRISPR-associated endonuclease/helicase Cas3
LDNFTIDEVFTLALNGKAPYPHQLETAKNLVEGRSVVLRAPCGSGKTEACYVSLLLGRNYSLPNRLIYSLPTRALVEDVSYRIKKGISKIGLPPIVSPQHGANSEDPFFRSEIVVATIDQTVGAYCCTPLSLPVYLGNIPAGAAVSSFLCFDEAHVYDHMLGLQSMLVLVERTAELGLPFLVMSATLPDSFIEWFRNNEKFGDRIAMVEGNDEDVPKRRNRRVILRLKGKLLGCKDVLDCADSWRRVMVVCNTVDRAQELFGLVNEALENGGFDVFLLHSRFLDEDREVIEDKMKARLKDSGKKTCLITTQVCEVGLDISCDMLLTELAPPDSLIQRMGRCAREGGEGEVWVFEVEHCAPYNEEDMGKSRKYLLERLDVRRIGWNEESEFVNTLLGEEFKQIMTDERRRHNVLLSLGDAAFKGSKHGIESNIREVLSANITIHDNPHKLCDYCKILRMSWIDVDIRVLARKLKNAKFWRIDFEHDENGRPDFKAIPATELFPYEYYVIHPDYLRYDSKRGLIFGEKGENLESSPFPSESKSTPTYEEETWEKHVENCLIAFGKIRQTELHALKLLSRIINCDLPKSEGFVALSIVVHDLGKLNERWQKSIDKNVNDISIPLAHIPLNKKIGVPHALISADASYPMFKKLINNTYYALSFKLAIAHHHHTRAEHVDPYVLKWKTLYDRIVNKISDEYSLDANPEDIRAAEKLPKRMEASMFDLESKPYIAYCIIARFIRLSDQKSFSIEKAKT